MRPARPNPEVLFRHVNDETILVHLDSGAIFSLNETGSRYWQLLESGLAPEALLDRMAEEFDVARSQLAREIAELQTSLLEAGLVEVGAPAVD